MTNRTPSLFRAMSVGALVYLASSTILPAESLISYAEGQVTVHRGSSVLEGDIGLALTLQDRIETGPDSLAILQLEDRGVVKLRDETVLELTSLGDDLEVTLARGGLFSRVRRLAGRGYGVRTPNVIAAVRGTEFFVAYGRSIEDEPDIWLCVNEGSVAVSLEDTGDSVVVEEGEGINILASNRITDPKFYPWTAELNWNTDPSLGAVTDETDLSGAYADLRDFDYD